MLIYVSIIFLVILLLLINKPNDKGSFNNILEKMSKKDKYTLNNIKRKCLYYTTTIPFKIKLNKISLILLGILFKTTA